jgi:predicted transcriptional regulator
VQKRVAEATGVSERTIRRILKGREEHEEQVTSFGMPGKKHNVPKQITQMDNFDKCVVWRTIHSFYA